MDLQEIIERIGYIRTRANLSARALSQRIGKADSYINRMEQNAFVPSLQTLIDIVDACDSSLEEFFSKDIASYKSKMEVFGILENLKPGKIDALKTLLSNQ